MSIQTATLAAGCFWCVEAVFERVNGVISVVAGYTGGNTIKPSYDEVSSGRTNHVEAIQIEFNDSIIAYKDLLRIFFLTHDPTTINQQGSDIGTQYRSVIFYKDEQQRIDAEEVKKETEDKKIYSNPIVTEITSLTKFYPAEEYHQNFYNNNREYPYCKIVIDPKLLKLRKEFAEKLKE